MSSESRDKATEEADPETPFWLHRLAEYVAGGSVPVESKSELLETNVIDATFKERLSILRRPISEITEEIHDREILTRLLSEEVRSKADHLLFLLSELDTWALGYNDSIEDRRTWLQQEILALEREQRAERLRFWEDVIALVNKRREYIMEYETLHHIAETGRETRP